MKFFYIAEEKSIEGTREIHVQDCPNIPDMLNRKYLGPFNNHKEALRSVLKLDPFALCCPICCEAFEHKKMVNPAGGD